MTNLRNSIVLTLNGTEVVNAELAQDFQDVSREDWNFRNKPGCCPGRRPYKSPIDFEDVVHEPLKRLGGVGGPVVHNLKLLRSVMSSSTR